ncbi:MOXD1 homolog 1-like [Bacillus rossius redtenbacheri]|uniref:MOXD1 homolog 1-like n=1 Tax=Bacillus rossius redtenbacheri TaxID=93214 RepID=UPI002FDD4C5B
MTRAWVLVLLVLVLAAVLAAAGAQRGRRHSWLDAGRVRLQWGRQGDELVLLLEAATAGYVGLGFSPGGGMAGADMVVGWVDDASGQPHLLDCWGPEEGAAPLVDGDQNYRLLRAHQNHSHTVLEFSRALSTCDTSHDVVLGEDTVRVIWALHGEDPVLQDGRLLLQPHSPADRGARSLHLLAEPPRLEPRPAGLARWEVLLRDVELPDNMDTLYWCKIFKAPQLQGKHHMVGYEPVLQSGSAGLVHHMLLYQCVATQQSATILDSHVLHPGAACYSADMPAAWEQCLTPVVAWAVGSQGEFLPNHIGLPLAEDHQSTFFMLETHYDNPQLRRAKDSSGLRVFYTADLRQYDGGMLATGVAVSPLHVVPPRQPEYRTAGYCNSQCTQRMLPQTGVRLVSVLLHSHLAGRRMRVRHLRDGQEVGVVAQDGHYDYNYQQSRLLGREVQLLPGDELVTECSYHTVDRTRPTFVRTSAPPGGYSTKQEMCLAFILYYPRTSLASCYSMTPVKYFFETFGVKEFYNVSMAAVEGMLLKLGPADVQQGDQGRSPQSGLGAADPEAPRERSSEDGGGLFDQLVIRQPQEFQNKTFTSHLFELPWEESLLTHSIEESFFYGPHVIFCRQFDDQLAIFDDQLAIVSASAPPSCL